MNFSTKSAQLLRNKCLSKPHIKIFLFRRLAQTSFLTVLASRCSARNLQRQHTLPTISECSTRSHNNHIHGSDTTDLRETAELFSEAFCNVYKAADTRPEPRVEARQLVNQMAALALTPEATRSVLEGINPHKSDRPDKVHPSLVKILADLLVEPSTAL